MKTQSLLLGLLLSITVVVAGFQSPNLFAAELKKADDTLVTPAMKLPSLKGKTHELKDYLGKVVLVQYWATYCTPCRKEMPSMNMLIKKLEEAKVPFEILAVNMGETKDEVQKFVDEVKPEFTVLLAPSSGEDMQAWNVFAAPSNFLIDPTGKIRFTLFGGVEWDADEIVETIKTLAKPAEASSSDKSEKSEKAVEKTDKKEDKKAEPNTETKTEEKTSEKAETSTEK